jgi:NAD(P)-dependent dehydrogenase (short-subunit alcohol dehydrogenase family)
MALSFDGRVAVVTGAGAGLGRAHALLLAQLGASVVVNDVSGPSADGLRPADAVVAEIREAGGRAAADASSVSTPEGGAAIIQTAVDEFGTVDIVVNNAGIVRDKSFAKMTHDLLQPVLDVHLNGAFYVSRPAFEIMRAKGYGRIVSTTSTAGLFGNFGQTNYGAAKMGLVGFTRVLALEGRKYGIQSNLVSPIAATSMSAGLLDEDWERRLDPSLVSPAVAWLAHEDCPANGEILSVAAGRVARIFIAETRGFYSPSLTVDDIKAQWENICAEDGYSVPTSAEDERGLLERAFEEAEGRPRM